MGKKTDLGFAFGIDEEMRKGIHALFNNKFSMAKAIFEAHAKE